MLSSKYKNNLHPAAANMSTRKDSRSLQNTMRIDFDNNTVLEIQLQGVYSPVIIVSVDKITLPFF
jgi:hypothetical protein